MNYQRIYNQIINQAREENRVKVKGGVYYESHHIIPKCLGGNNSKKNLILLTAREHFICHLLLVEIYPENQKLQYAAWAFVNQIQNKNQQRHYKISGRVYERLKIIAAENISKLHTGRKDSEEVRQKKSKAHTGKKLSEETLQKLRKPKPTGFGNKISQRLKNKKKSAEHIKNMSESKKGKSSWSKGVKFTEEHIRNNKLGQKNRREVNQLTLDGTFIKTWESISDAVKQYGIGVSHCLMKKQKSTKGYKWEYTTSEPPMKRIGGKIKKEK